jgi:hypothetical protein
LRRDGVSKMISNVTELQSNPMVTLLDEPHLLGDISPPIIIDIAPDVAAPIDLVYHQGYDKPVQDIVLQTSLDDCPDVDPNDEIPIFVRWNDVLFIHDPRFVLLDNDIASPLQDGGGDVASKFGNPYRPGFTMKCSNVPRTFLNEDGCYLSHSSSVCSSNDREPYDDGGSRGNFPYTPVQINHEFLRAVYNVTGTATPGATLYLYAIDNLDISRDPNAEPPCQPGSMSRWVSGPCTGVGPKVAFDTKQFISEIIYYFRQETTTQNRNIVDIYQSENLEYSCNSNDLTTVGFEVTDLEPSMCCLGVHQGWKIKVLLVPGYNLIAM